MHNRNSFTTWFHTIVMIILCCSLNACGGGSSPSTPPSNQHLVTVTADIKVTDGSNDEQKIVGHRYYAVAPDIQLSLYDETNATTQAMGAKNIPIGEDKIIKIRIPYTNHKYHFIAPSQTISADHKTCTLQYAKNFELNKTTGETQQLDYTCKTLSPNEKTPGHVIAGYYTNYGDSIPGGKKSGVDTLENAVKQGYNVIDIAFFNFKKNNGQWSTDDSTPTNILKCNPTTLSINNCIESIKATHPNVKILISIGGANGTADTGDFLTQPNLAPDQILRILHLKHADKVDGIDFDIEGDTSRVVYAKKTNFIQMIGQLHAYYPNKILTFAPQSGDQELVGPKSTALYYNLWQLLLTAKNKWDGWFQVQFYNQDSQPTKQEGCMTDRPFDSYFQGTCDQAGANSYQNYVDVSDPGGPDNSDDSHSNFDSHFVIGTPASAVAATDFNGIKYIVGRITPANKDENTCKNLDTTHDPLTPDKIAQNYIVNAHKDHPNIRGYMSWDISNDYGSSDYDCKKYNITPAAWHSYSWVTTIIKNTPKQPATAQNAKHKG